LFTGDAPGWGIEVDERLAAKYPFGNENERGEGKGLNGGGGDLRRLDGTIVKPWNRRRRACPTMATASSQGGRDHSVTQSLHALPYGRAWNIAFRTAHIGFTGVLFGGHVFGREAGTLLPWLYLTIFTGGVLVFLEAFPSWRWCCQGRAVMVVTKLCLVCLVPWLWSYRVPILTLVIVLGSVGSHMPRRFRYYSVIERRVVADAKYAASSQPNLGE
jgi:hypothetical protein